MSLYCGNTLLFTNSSTFISKSLFFCCFINSYIRLREITAKQLNSTTKTYFNSRTLYKKRNSKYDTILQDNVQQLANYLQDKSKKLQFDIPALQMSRNDDLKVREYLQNMTPEERRGLGINRNTLWYIQKNLREGKNIKIYDKVKAKIV